MPRAATSPAQTKDDKTARQTRLLLENCLKADEELTYLTAKVAALTKLDGQTKELLSALDSQITAQEKTITALKAANAASNGIETLSEKELKSFQASLDDAKKEIARWRAKAGFWRRVAGFGLPLVLAVGVVVGYVLGGK